MNTQYDEREYAVALTLEKKSDSGYSAQNFPDGTVFLFQGERLQANANNAGVIVPIKRSGKYELQIETALFGFDRGEYQLRAVLYSASEANYYNSIHTERNATTTTFTVVEAPTYALSVNANGDGASQIVSAGESLDITVRARRESTSASDEPNVGVALYQYQKDSDKYTPVNASAVFTSGVSTLTASGEGVSWKPVISESAVSATYRLEFTYGDKTDYLDFIVQ
jgi:hypothetical protein